MTNGKLQAEQFGEAATQWGEQFFRIRVTQEDDKERLRAMIEAEADRSNVRKDRIAFVNKRLDKI